MNPSKSKNLIIKVVSIVLLANFGLANLVFAQAAPGDPGFVGPVQPTIPQSFGRADLEKAQGNNNAATTPAACATFSTLVKDVTGGTLLAAWRKEKDRFKKDIYTCDLYGKDVKVAADGSVDLDELGKRDPSIKYLQTSLSLGGRQVTGSIITKDNWAAKQSDAQKTAESAAGTSDIVGWVLNAVLNIVASALGVLTAIAGAIMDSAIKQIIYITEAPQVVKIGWAVVRDISNMFFILILIVISLGIILRLKDYQEYGHLITQLILMAILVNFSLVIAQTITNAVNFVAGIFAPNGISEIASAMFAMYNFENFFNGHIDWKYGLTNGLGAIVFEIVGLVVFLALAAMFVIRMVGLYILMIFSPIAYVARILPITQKWSEEWWKHFIKYLIWAPVALFMIKLTIIVASNANFSGQGPGDTALKFWIMAAFLAAALLVAKQAGMVGADTVLNAGKAVGKFGLGAADRWLAKGAKMKGEGKWNAVRRAGSYLSVGAWKRGWELRSKEKEQQAYTISAGKRADLFNRVISREATDFALRGQQAEVAEHEKHITTKNREELATLAKLAIEEKDPYKALAYANRMAANYDLNELLSFNGYTTDAKGLVQYTEEKLVPLMGKQAAYRAAYDLSRTAEEVNHWNYARIFTGKFDDKTGEIEYDINGEVPDDARDASGAITNFDRIDFSQGADKERLIEIGKQERRQQVGRSNRLGWDFQETDIIDPATGEHLRRNVGWGDFGRRRWATEIADNEANNQFNVNTIMNVMLHNSKDALKSNKSLWIQQVNAKLAEMTPDQIKQWRNRIAAPKEGWDAKVAAGQTFTGIETIERYIADGDLTEQEIDDMGRYGENIMEALEHHRTRGGGRTAPAGGASPVSSPNPVPPNP